MVLAVSEAAAEGAFPADFVWGVAASAPQTEGWAGRGRSVWDVFAAEAGRIKDGSDLSVGTGFEAHFGEDIELAAAAGVKAFRFSIAWPRVQPDGRGAADAAGLDLYERIVDAMLARGIAPWATLFHWDLPAALPGGWLSRDTAARLADYASLVARRLGDRVGHFMVLNEPNVVAILGHAMGWHAPGLASRGAWAAAAHHQNLAQGLAFAALRAELPEGSKVGTALSMQPVRPAVENAAHERAAAVWDAAWNRVPLDPLLGRAYPEMFAEDFAPLLQAGDMQAIAARPDFLGLNYYSRMHIAPAPKSALGAGFGPSPRGAKLTDVGWPIEPQGLAEQLAEFRDRYDNLPVYVTENGAAYDNAAAADGVIADPLRVDFLREHLLAASSACAAGCNLRGVFAWTLTDNFEWTDGFATKFGMVAVDRATLTRTPKRSLHWFGACAQANAVVS